jgi:hypothetical protein
MGPFGWYYVNDMAFIGDSLYVASGPEVDGMPVDFAVAAAVADLPGTCQFNAVPDGLNSASVIMFAPNPTAHELLIQSERKASMTITNAMGQLIWNGTGSSMVVDVSAWVPGLYTLHHPGGAEKVMVAR